jgi:NAD(P)-dependent dehydrogenase (short-subunit alcohol dehydrogenase family)
MKTVRRSSWEQGIRINYVAPCWIKSAIRTKEYEDWLIERGVEFGEQADCAGAMMRIACDKSVNGMPNHTPLLCACLETKYFGKYHG